MVNYFKVVKVNEVYYLKAKICKMYCNRTILSLSIKKTRIKKSSEAVLYYTQMLYAGSYQQHQLLSRWSGCSQNTPGEQGEPLPLPGHRRWPSETGTVRLGIY